MKSLFLASFGLCWLLAGGVAQAERLLRENVPEPLKPWVDWVLFESDEIFCPFDPHKDSNYCTELGILNIAIDHNGGTFDFVSRSHVDSWVILPGSEAVWPVQIQLDGEAVEVLNYKGMPWIEQKKGNHVIAGKFRWLQIPERLPVPVDYARIKLTVNGKVVVPVLRPDEGKGAIVLSEFLQVSQDKNEPQDEAYFNVMRRIIDSVPMVVETVVKLDIAGKQREIDLKNLLLPGATLVTQKSTLPLRFDSAGIPVVLVKPGQYQVTFQQHLYEATTEVKLAATLAGVAEEVWVFAGQPEIRQVKITEPETIDARDTRLPAEWKNLSAYLLKPGQALKLDIIKTGDPTPNPNRLEIDRKWWLDFDGSGFMVRDKITGVINRDFRMNLANPYDLARALVSGSDQYITRDKEGVKGVEVRERNLSLVAESRLNQAPSAAKLGWDQAFHKAQGQLALPPGWRVWHGSGMDTLEGAWINKWTLLDLFMVFIIVQAIGKLWGWPQALIGALAVAFTWHEPGAPQWLWVHIILAKGLAKVVPAGIFYKLNGIYRYLATAGFLLVAVPFLVDLVRHALHPQLEQPATAVTQAIDHQTFGNAGSRNELADSGSVPEEDLEMVQEQAYLSAPVELPLSKAMTRNVKKAKPRSYKQDVQMFEQNLLRKDPNLVVQTGAGLPSWDWHKHKVLWDGPVSTDEEVRFYLTPPWVNRGLSFVCFVMWLALILMVLELTRNASGRWQAHLNFLTKAGMLVLVCLAMAPPVLEAAEIPNKEMLDELRTRLQDRGDCDAKCVFIESSHISVNGQNLKMQFRVHAFGASYINLPLDERYFAMTKITLDDQDVKFFLGNALNNGTTVQINKGVHDIEVQGRIYRDEMTLDFVHKPRVLSVSALGWDVTGLAGVQLESSHLLFQKQLNASNQAESQKELFKDTVSLPNYFRVERTLQFGIEWMVRTVVQRLGSSSEAVDLKVKLLPGESIMTEGLKKVGHSALVGFDRGQDSETFITKLTPEAQLELIATDEPRVVETWQFEIAPMIHVDFAGIAPLVADAGGEWRPKWRPWPNEKLTLNIGRPEGAKGQTVTIDRSQIEVKPGKRTVEGNLRFHLRTSIGGRHTIGFPADTELLKLTINSQVQNIKLKGNKLTFPIVPGSQDIDIKFRQQGGLTAFYKTPQFDLGVASVNHVINLEMPTRWVLFVDGPVLGPAVLFWGELIVLVLMSLGLGRLKFLPLKTHHWLLISLGTGNIDFFATLIVVLWFLAVSGKKLNSHRLKGLVFNVTQIGLLGLSVVALMTIYMVLATGLLSAPNMEIHGYGSHSWALNWYLDRMNSLLPEAGVISLPIIAYRLFMLLWALWFAHAMTRWARWFWDGFSAGGYFKWQRKQGVKSPAVAEFSTSPAATDAAPGTNSEAEEKTPGEHPNNPFKD